MGYIRPLPARPSLGEQLRRLGVWLLGMTLPELVGGVLLIRALPWATATLRGNLAVGLLAAATLQLVMGLALWRRQIHWWVLLFGILVGLVAALLR